MSPKNPTVDAVSRFELMAVMKALRWEMRLWIVCALLISKGGPTLLDLLKDGSKSASVALRVFLG